MPIYDYSCQDCGKTFELLVTLSEEKLACPACGGFRLKKLLSPHSSFSGAHRSRVPGAGDTACCGSSPAAASCAGPGSCCGKTFS